jgi:hypothetical protein
VPTTSLPTATSKSRKVPNASERRRRHSGDGSSKLWSDAGSGPAPGPDPATSARRDAKSRITAQYARRPNG